MTPISSYPFFLCPVLPSLCLQTVRFAQKIRVKCVHFYDVGIDMGSTIFDFTDVKSLYLWVSISKTVNRWIHRSFKNLRRVTCDHPAMYVEKRSRLCQRIFAFSQVPDRIFPTFPGAFLLLIVP